MTTSSSARVLLVTDVRFWRGTMGSGARISSLISWLQRMGHCLKVMFIGDLHGDDEHQLQALFPNLTVVVANRSCSLTWLDRLSPRSILAALRLYLHARRWRTLPNHPPTLDSYYRPDCRRLMARLIAEVNPSHVIIEYVRLAYLLPDHAPTGMCSIIDSHDVQSDRWQQFQTQGQFDTLAILPSEERRALERANHVLAIQPLDAERLRNLGLTSVHVVMHAHPLIDLPWKATGVVLFVGSNMTPNVDAAQFLLACWPQIHRATGQRTELRIVGSVCSSLTNISLPDGVKLMGRVDDLLRVYADTELVVNPVRYGSGLKIKSVEALCHGRPLLTSPAGADGLPASPDAYAISPLEYFTQRAVELLNSPAQQLNMARAASLYAHRYFSETAAYGPLTQLLESRA